MDQMISRSKNVGLMANDETSEIASIQAKMILARRKRACMQSIIPTYVLDAAIEESRNANVPEQMRTFRAL